MIGCKFNGGVNVIEISSEGLEVVKGVCPYHEDVVYERDSVKCGCGRRMRRMRTADADGGRRTKKK